MVFKFWGLPKAKGWNFVCIAIIIAGNLTSQTKAVYWVIKNSLQKYLSFMYFVPPPIPSPIPSPIALLSFLPQPQINQTIPTPAGIISLPPVYYLQNS